MIQFKAKTTNGEIIKSALSPFTFPAGEVSVKREDRRELENIEIAIVYGSADSIHKDLFTVAMWSDYLTRESSSSKQVLVIPYVPGARADKDTPHGPTVYAMQLAMTNIDEIIIFDPHSPVIVEALKKIPATKITTYTPEDLFSEFSTKQVLPKNFEGVIAPDEGAVDRASQVADALGVPLYRATKKRDPNTGKLSSFEVEELPDSGHLLIVDDICDGGGTFLGLLSAIPARTGKISLYVSHGVFSGKALDNLYKGFHRIYTTNSYAPDRKLASYTYGAKMLDDSATAYKRIDVISMMLKNIEQ
jgi:ribose-phosphate pyrophosphokinase